ncbi:MAG: fructosamine kinase family protein [Alcanivorax sp.]|nr:fructosamine kinase family protein [Alcanivorax sp.]
MPGAPARFVKYHDEPALLVAEKAGLHILENYLPVPRVEALQRVAPGALLVMDYHRVQSLRASAQWRRAGQALGLLHGQHAESYGADSDNFIGAMPQLNAWCDSWPDFFARFRLLPQCDFARKNGLPAPLCEQVLWVAGQLERWLPARPPASLLHGDLWRGNLGWSEGAPFFL